MRSNTMILFSCAALLAACAPPGQVSNSGYGAYEVSLAAWSDGLAVAWYDTRDGNAEIYVRALDADGRVAGPELRITTTAEQSYEADIAPLTDAFAVAWYEKSGDQSLRAQLGVWTRDGTPQWMTPVGMGRGSSRNPVVRSFGDELFCAWIETSADGRELVWGGWWDRQGQPRSAPVMLGAAGANTWNLNAAIAASGDAWVVFDAQAATRAEELYLATLSAGSATLNRITADDGISSKYPDISLAGDRGAITWFDERDGNREVYLTVASMAELTQPIEARARRVTESLGSSIGAYLAWNGDRVGLAWSDDSGGNYEVYFQEFDVAGEPFAAPRAVRESPANSMIPAIRPWRDGFALAWDEVTPANGDSHDAGTRSEAMFAVVARDD